MNSTPKLLIKESIHFIPSDILAESSKHPLLKELITTGAGYLQNTFVHRSAPNVNCHLTLLYCISGEGSLTINNKSTTFTKGTILFLDHFNYKINYKSSDTNPWTVYWVNFEGARAGNFFELLDLDFMHPFFNIKNNPRVISFYHDIITMLSRGYNLTNLVYASSCLKNMLSYLSVINVYRSSWNNANFNMDNIINKMLERIHSKLTLTELADFFKLSEYHFSREFKKRAGHSPIDYYIRLKIQNATQTLLTSKKTIQEISINLGYDDQYYFSRIFKKIMGMSPDKYRMHNKQ